MDRFDFDDKYLVRLRNKDADAWRHFDGYFRSRVLSKLRAQFPWSMVDDLVEDVMLAVVEKIFQGEPRDPARLPAYVFSICDYKGLEMIRRRAKEKVSDVDWDLLPGNAKTPQQQSLSKEVKEKISRVLGKLNKRDSDILVAIFYHDTDRDEVCREFGIAREQLRLILFHARQRFQREWKRD